VLGLVLLAGCNQLFGLQATKLASDADSTPQVCDPLPFDANRYFKINQVVNGMTWAIARQECQSYGFDLAVLDANDPSEIANELDGGTLPFWFGVSYDGTAWTAIDGCPPELAWAPAEPANESVGECAFQSADGLRVRACTAATDVGNNGLSALCETARPSAQCRAQAVERTYTVIDATRTTLVSRDDAAAMCGALGMHIVEIDSTDELNHLLANEAAGLTAFWVGAKRTQSTFTSPTGCPQIFVWNRTLFDRDCVMWDGAMDSDYCNQPTASALCELNVAM
jgi:hypothetical protein